MSRLEAGGIVTAVALDGGDSAEVRFERCPAGWQASFELRHPGVDDLAVVHRLVAPTLAEARAAVPQAATYLLGCPVDLPLPVG